MDYCLKTLKNIERITKTYKYVSRLKTALSVFLIGYTVYKAVGYFMQRG